MQWKNKNYPALLLLDWPAPIITSFSVYEKEERKDDLKYVYEGVENEYCNHATKVSQTLLKMVGKAFQGITNLVIA